MVKQPARTPAQGEGDADGVQRTAATQDESKGTGTTFDDGAGSVAVDSSAAANESATGTGAGPKAVEWPYGDLPVDEAVAAKVASEGSGEAGSAEHATVPEGGSVAEPGAEELVKTGAKVAGAYDDEAKLFAEFLAWKQGQQLGAPEQVTNAASNAARVERNQLGLGPEYQRLLAAAPEAFVVTRELGVSVYVPVEAPEPTAEERKQGAMRPAGLSRQVVVPYRSALPYGTTHEQLQYLLTLGWVVPAEAR